MAAHSPSNVSVYPFRLALPLLVVGGGECRDSKLIKRLRIKDCEVSAINKTTFITFLGTQGTSKKREKKVVELEDGRASVK